MIEQTEGVKATLNIVSELSNRMYDEIKSIYQQKNKNSTWKLETSQVLGEKYLEEFKARTGLDFYTFAEEHKHRNGLYNALDSHHATNRIRDWISSQNQKPILEPKPEPKKAIEKSQDAEDDYNDFGYNEETPTKKPLYSEDGKVKWSKEQRVYFDLRQDAEDIGYSCRSTIDWTMEQKEARMVEKIKSLNAEFEEQAGMTIQEFCKKYPKNFSLEEIARHVLTGEKTRGRPSKKKQTKEDRLAVRLENHGVASKAVAVGMIKSVKHKDPTVWIDWNYRVHWIGDCIGAKFMKQIRKDKGQGIGITKREDLLYCQQELEKLRDSNYVEYLKNAPRVELTDSEIRTILGKPNLRIRDIRKLVKGFVEASIHVEVDIWEEEGKWMSIGQMGTMCFVEYEQTGRTKKRTGKPETYYVFIFDRVEGLAFLSGLERGWFSTYPKSFYNKLNPGAQLIGRSFLWTIQPSTLTLDDLCKVGQIKNRNITERQRTVEDYLKQLEQNGFIAGWKRGKNKKTGEIQYQIQKVKKLPHE